MMSPKVYERGVIAVEEVVRGLSYFMITLPSLFFSSGPSHLAIGEFSRRVDNATAALIRILRTFSFMIIETRVGSLARACSNLEENLAVENSIGERIIKEGKSKYQ